MFTATVISYAHKIYTTLAKAHTPVMAVNNMDHSMHASVHCSGFHAGLFLKQL
jgi:hypothetical protein